MAGVAALPGGRAWAISQIAGIWATDDGGLSWVQQRPEQGWPWVSDPHRALVVRDDHAWSVAPDGCYRTDRSGYSDLRPPVTTCSVPNWIKATTSATFSAADDKTSVAGTWYQLDGGPWTQGNSAPLVVDPFGLTQHHLFVASQDGYGNWETPQEFYTNIDVKGPAPVVTPKVKYMMDWWYNKTSSIKMSGDDQGIGGGGVKVKRGSAAWQRHPNGWVMVTRARTDHRNDGVHVFKMCAYDDLGNVGKTVTHDVCLDTRRPTGTAYPTTGRARHSATFKFVIHDKTPCAPKAIVKITVKTLGGTALGYYDWTWYRKNRVITLTFGCPLPAGTYRYVISAGDGAGNVIKSPPRATLTMRSSSGIVALASSMRQMRLGQAASERLVLARYHR